MTKPVTIPNTFATATTAIPLSNLDADFSTVATAMNDANTYSNYAPDTGSANAYVVTLTGVSTTYSAGLRIQFKAGNANTTASTLNVNAQGAKNITYQDASALASGTIAANSIVDVMYDGTQFLLMNDPAGGTGGDVVGPASATDNAIARFDGTTGKLVQNSVVTIADSTGDISGVGQLNATTLDATNIEVTNIKAKDGTAAASIADSTGVVSITANPVLSGGTANGVAYLNGSKVLTTGSALTFDGNTLTATNTSGNAIIASRGSKNLGLTGNYAGANTHAVISTTNGMALAFMDESSEFMRLTSTGLGIGTSSPAVKLDIRGTTGASSTLRIGSDSNDSGTIQFFNTTGSTVNSTIAGNLEGGNSGGNIAFSTKPVAGSLTERMRLDASGNLGLGVTPSAWDTGNSVRAIQLPAGAVWSYSTLNVYLGANNYWNGTNRIYSSTNTAGEYNINGNVHTWMQAASGTAGNAISFTQAMTLDASGNLALGGTTNKVTGVTGGGSGFTVQASGAPTLAIWDTSDASYYTNITQINEVSYIWNIANGAMIFGTNNTERARITSSGDFVVGTNAASGRIHGYSGTNSVTSGYFNNVTGDQTATTFKLVSARTDVFYHAQFFNGTTTECWRVEANGDTKNTNNSYGGLSDAKIKENIVDASPKLQDLLKVKVRNYNLIGSTTKQIGVVAQELEEVFPSMVDETEDRDADGNFLGTTTKGVKYSVFVPMLIKAIQELKSELDSVKAELATLKGN